MANKPKEAKNPEILALMNDEALKGDVISVALGTMIALNTFSAPKHGFFLPIEEATKSGWCSAMTPNHSHKFQDQNVKQGYLFHGWSDEDFPNNGKYPKPVIQFLGSIGPMIEVTRGNDKNPPYGLDGEVLIDQSTGDPIKPGDWVAEYVLGAVNPLYECLKKQEKATLRTIYWIKLWEQVNGVWKEMHKLPIELSLKGTSAGNLGRVLLQFRSLCAQFWSDYTGEPIQLNWNEQFYSQFFMEALLASESSGEAGRSSLCTVVKDFNLTGPFTAGNDAELIKFIKFNKAFYAEGQMNDLESKFLRKSKFHSLVQLPEASISNGPSDEGDEFPGLPPAIDVPALPADLTLE